MTDESPPTLRPERHHFPAAAFPANAEKGAAAPQSKTDDPNIITMILNIHRLARETVATAAAAMTQWKPEFRAIVYRAIAEEASAMAAKADVESPK